MRTPFSAICSFGTLGAAIAFVVASCGTFSGADENSPVDASPTDASNITTSDAGEAGLILQSEGGVPTCVAPGLTKTTICDDFDAPDAGIAAFWNVFNTAGGIYESVTAQFKSSPNSVFFQVPATESGNFTDLSAMIDFHAHVSIDMDFLINDQIASQSYVEIVDLSFDSSPIQTARIAIGEDDAHALINVVGGEAGAFVGSGANSVQYNGAWNHAHADFIFSATNGGAALKINDTAYTATTTNATLSAAAPSKIHVLVGDSPGAYATAVYLDNIAISASEN